MRQAIPIPEIQVRNVTLGARRVRVAYVAYSSIGFEGVSGIIKDACSFWGGWQSPIIPMREGEGLRASFGRLRHQYDPDVVVGGGGPLDDGLANALRRWTRPLRDGIVAQPAAPALAPHTTPLARICRRRDPFWLKHVPDHPSTAEARLTLQALFGSWTEETLNQLNSWPVRCMETAEELDPTGEAAFSVVINSAEQRLREQGEPRPVLTPGMVSMRYCSAWHDPGVVPPERPVVIVLGGTVEDYCLFYSLRRHNSAALWFPFLHEISGIAGEPTHGALCDLPGDAAELLRWVAAALAQV